MPEYRLYFRAPDGAFRDFKALYCDDDAQAAALATRLSDGRPVQLWTGSRVVELPSNSAQRTAVRR